MLGCAADWNGGSWTENKASDAGLNAVISALTANEDAREYIKNNVPNLVITYLTCPIEICIQRDSRGLYRKARKGTVNPKTLIGLDSPYEPPIDPDIVIDTSKNTLEQSVRIIKTWLKADGHKIFRNLTKQSPCNIHFKD